LLMNLKRMNMKKLRKDQKGFTILELVIVMLLTGIITAAITTTFFQVFNINTRTANHMIAVSQVQQAGKLVSEDMLEAQTVTVGGTMGFPLSMNWTEGGMSGDSHEVIYTLEDMPSGEFKRLQREYKINSVTESITAVAEYIDSDETSFELEGKVLIFTVTATVGEESETREYKVQPRPGT
jgi:prepilin-type N-terminal cleavage/methylation domain-containing protein